ncbi:two-partner secretion domain-containing protein [Calothrix sp. NIES-2098]|uniref:two-partner secretion domain-containing protein n=1 Tax=Calothrix sp. NIES-2098 TaxID=1954171 RepID=UPI000B5F1C24|nr:filamentous hemagglutinin outer membrane protein [Calothrix sp. NIES-2098]
MSAVFLRLDWLTGVKIAISGALIFWSNITLAQVTPDTSLGSESSIVIPNVLIKGLPSDRINGGAIRGANLFHSFQQFNVASGRGVYFTNPQGIENILSRVTGSNTTEIFGKLGVLGNANLYLMNPNGIVFGENASLDVQGSFVATTANAIKLGELGVFSASEPASSNLLSINPTALFYNVLAKEAEIINRSQGGINVPNGQSLFLVGGNVKLEGGVIKAPGGRVELGGLAAPGAIALSQNGKNLGLSFPDGVERADVLLTQSSIGDKSSEVNVRAGGNGSIAIHARDLKILERSALLGGIGVSQGSTDAVAGDITLNASGKIEVTQKSAIANNVSVGAVGSAGNIKITTGTLSVKDGSQILARSEGKGNAGSVTIQASDTVTLVGFDGNANPTVASDVIGGSSGNGNNVEITARKVNLQTDAIIAASILDGKGKNGERAQAGDVKITASEEVSLDSGSRVYSEVGSTSFGNGGTIFITAPKVSLENGADLITQVRAGGDGNAGNININTGTLSIVDKAQIIASTYGKGNAGNITIDAREAVNFNRGYAFSTVREGAEGNGGNIKITTGTLSVKDGSQILARSEGKGNAGSVTIQASDTVTLVGFDGNANPTVASDVIGGSSGNGNNVEITARKVNLQTDAIIAASILDGKGKNGERAQAGDVKITASEEVSLDSGSRAYSEVGSTSFGNGGTIFITAPKVSLENGADLITQVRAGGDGNAGNININTGTLSIVDKAQIIASTYGKGNAGNITIDAREAVSFDESYAFSTVEAGGVGDAGNIKITAGSLSLINGGQLDAFVRDADDKKPAGIGNAGDVSVNVRDAFTVSGVSGKLSGIFNRLQTGAIGSAGDITINAGSLSITGNAQLAATVGAGAVGSAGNIKITTGALSVKDGGRILARSEGQGDAGSVTIQASDTVTLAALDGNTRPTVASDVTSGSSGNGNNVEITARKVILQNDAIVAASILDGKGKNGERAQAGNVKVTASEEVSLNDSFIYSEIGSNSFGNGGTVSVTAPKVSLENRAYLIASTYGEGNAGGITVEAREAVSFDESYAFSTVEAGGVGDAGNIKITAGSLSLINGGQLDAFVRDADDKKPAGIGNAGDVSVNVRDAFTVSGVSGKLSGIFNRLQTGAIGSAGDITINAGSLSITGNAQLAATVGAGAVGSAGNININAGSLSITGNAQLSASTAGKGDAGNIKIEAEQISLSSNASIQGDVTETGNGKGANIELIAKGPISLTGGVNSARTGESTRITLGLLPNAQGVGGTLNIKAGSLVLKDGATIKNSTEGQGNAGSIYVNAGTVDISGSVPRSGLSSGFYTSTTTSGKAGDIMIETDKFRISDGAVLSALTNGDGDAGKITVIANKTFEALNGGQLVVTTLGNKPAGNIFIKADEVSFSGSDRTYYDRYNRLAKYTNPANRLFDNNSPASGVFASTLSSGNGGNVSLETTNLNLSDRALLSSQSQGAGTAGNIIISSRQTLNANNSNISTAAVQSSGGAIAIKAADIRLYGDSNITTNVGSGAGGGGNITLSANSIIAFDDSDIFAFARDGKGGNITFNTLAFFGQNYQPAPFGIDPLTLDGNNVVDINASGAVAGNISIPDTSFIQNSLSDLPENPIDTSSLIANSCIARSSRQPEGTFIITGSGGLPSRPGEALISQYTLGTVRNVANSSPSANSTHRPWQKGDPIVEPQGAYRLPSARLVLSRECSQ